MGYKFYWLSFGLSGIEKLININQNLRFYIQIVNIIFDSLIILYTVANNILLIKNYFLLKLVKTP